MWIRVVEGVEWSAACAQAMDTLALKLEPKPCLVHRLALVKLVQLVLVLQLALLIGCASFAGAGIACSVSHRLGAHGGGAVGRIKLAGLTVLPLRQEHPLLLERARHRLLLRAERALDRLQTLRLPPQLLPALVLLAAALLERLVGRPNLRLLLAEPLQVLCVAAGARG